jgi:hypothetical protein
MSQSRVYFRIFTLGMLWAGLTMPSVVHAHGSRFGAVLTRVRSWWNDHPKLRIAVGCIVTTTVTTGALIASDSMMRYGMGRLHMPCGVSDGIKQVFIALGTAYAFSGTMALVFSANNAFLERVLGDEVLYDVQRDEQGREKSREVAQCYYAFPSTTLAALYFFGRQGIKSPAAWLCTAALAFGVWHEVKRR